jgi:uncharacterized membrane protein
MSNFVLMLFSGLFNGLGDFCSKMTAGKISPYLAAMFLSLFSAITIAIYLIFIKGLEGNINMTKQGFLFSVILGLLTVSDLRRYNMNTRNIITLNKGAIMTLRILETV